MVMAMCLVMAIALKCVAIVGKYQAQVVDDSETPSARNVCNNIDFKKLIRLANSQFHQEVSTVVIVTVGFHSTIVPTVHSRLQGMLS